MPEPVVIIGPANGPAGPTPGQPDAGASATIPDAAEAVDSETAATATRAGAAVLAGLWRVLRITLSLANRAARAITSVLMQGIRQYPRHSMAAGASLLILGGILYSQAGSKTGRHDVTNAISGNPSPGAPQSKLPEPDSGTKVAGEPKGRSEKEKSATSEPTSPPKPENTDAATVQTEPAAPVLPAPKPESTGQDQKRASALAAADSPEKDLKTPDPAPAPVVTSTEPGMVPLPAPAPDSAKATLLSSSAPQELGPPPAPPDSVAKDEKKGDVIASGSSAIDHPLPAPASSGDQVSKTSPMPEVPGDLWLADGAPKAGVDQSPKNNGALAANTTGEKKPLDEPKKTAEADAARGVPATTESKPLEEPKRIEGPAPLPVEPSRTPSEPAVVPGGTSATPSIGLLNLDEHQPVPAPARQKTPGSLEVMNQPIPASKADEHGRRDDKANHDAHESTSGLPAPGAPPSSPATGASGAAAAAVIGMSEGATDALSRSQRGEAAAPIEPERRHTIRRAGRAQGGCCAGEGQQRRRVDFDSELGQGSHRSQ